MYAYARTSGPKGRVQRKPHDLMGKKRKVPTAGPCVVCYVSRSHKQMVRCTSQACHAVTCRPCLNRWYAADPSKRGHCPLCKEDLKLPSVLPHNGVVLGGEEIDWHTQQWLETHTKPCPHCHRLVEKEGGCDRVRCFCHATFCYRCGQPLGQCRCTLMNQLDWREILQWLCLLVVLCVGVFASSYMPGAAPPPKPMYLGFHEECALTRSDVCVVYEEDLQKAIQQQFSCDPKMSYRSNCGFEDARDDEKTMLVEKARLKAAWDRWIMNQGGEDQWQIWRKTYASLVSPKALRPLRLVYFDLFHSYWDHQIYKARV